MFLIKIFHFFEGYVILLVTGKNKEETLNKFTAVGAMPKCVVKEKSFVKLELSARDFAKIQKCGLPENVTVEKCVGVPFWPERLKKRKTFLIGTIMFFVFFSVGSQFIWSVEYDVPDGCDTGQIERALDIAGVKVGVPKKQLADGIDIKNIILNNTDNISWCWVYIKGTRAVVKVRESIIPPEIFNPDTPCDIIAMRSGIIKRIITERGRTVVGENTAVAPGDVIISGTYTFDNNSGYNVHSKGTVEAYTEHVKKGTYKQYYCYKRYTGRKRRFLTLNIYKWNLPLYINRDTKFKEYESEIKNRELHIGEYFFGIGIQKTTYKEFVTEKEPISYDTCVDMAQKELERQISSELLPPAQLVDKSAEVEKIDDETLAVTVKMKFIEQIGTEKRIDEVKLIEPKTDKPAAGN